MASQTKRKHSETFNTKELRDLCGNIRNDNKEKAFERIRQWLNNNKDDDNRMEAAITYQDVDKWTPLHAILIRQPPLDIIQTIIKYAPRVLKMKDSYGQLPIHYMHNYGSLDILNLLIESYPEGMDQKDKDGKTPLDYFKAKKYAKIKDDNKMLPLHHACKKGYSDHLIRFLIQAYPKSIKMNDNHGRTPLDCYTSFQGRQSCDEISALLQTANMKRNSPVFAPAPAPQEADIHVAQVLPIAGNEAVPQIAEIENELVQQSESEVKMELTQIESNINELKSEMVELKSEMKVELNAFKASVQSDMTEIKSEMKVELNAFKASIQSDMTEIKSMLRQFGAI